MPKALSVNTFIFIQQRLFSWLDMAFPSGAEGRGTSPSLETTPPHKDADRFA